MSGLLNSDQARIIFMVRIKELKEIIDANRFHHISHKELTTDTLRLNELLLKIVEKK